MHCYVYLQRESLTIHRREKLYFICVRHENIWGRWGIDPLILNLGTTWRWVVSFNPPSPPLNKRLSGLQSRFRRCGGRKNPLRLLEIEPCVLGCPACSIVTRPPTASDFIQLKTYGLPSANALRVNTTYEARGRAGMPVTNVTYFSKTHKHFCVDRCVVAMAIFW